MQSYHQSLKIILLYLILGLGAAPLSFVPKMTILGISALSGIFQSQELQKIKTAIFRGIPYSELFVAMTVIKCYSHNKNSP